MAMSCPRTRAVARDSQYVSIGEEARPFLYQPLARVRSRARELAIRLAIGAAPRDVALLVVRQALTWTGGGTALGLAVAFGLTRFLASLLYGVNPADPWTFGGVALLIALVACAAALVPARRASRQDPLATLRDA